MCKTLSFVAEARLDERQKLPGVPSRKSSEVSLAANPPAAASPEQPSRADQVLVRHKECTELLVLRASRFPNKGDRDPSGSGPTTELPR